jgi:aryl-alcohol dehydrogenase-like predicted oxidoreductase
MDVSQTTQSDMEFAKIPGTTIRASRVALGTWAIGGWMRGGSDESDAIRTIHAALERGVNLIDTAPVYGFGRSEEIVGKALAMDGRRRNALIATKVGLDWKDGKPFRNAQRARIIEEVESSLRRLQTDVIDLYQVHWPPDPDSPALEEGWSTLADLKREGKVRWIGVSNFNVQQLKRARKIAPVTSLQPPYSLVHREIEDEILPYCLREGIGVIVYSPMASGLLTGAMTRERATRLSKDDWRKGHPDFTEPNLSRNLALVDRLREIAKRHNRSVGEVAITWTLRNPAVTGAIVGARNARQAEGVMRAGDLRLSDKEVSEIEEFLEEVA